METYDSAEQATAEETVRAKLAGGTIAKIEVKRRATVHIPNEFLFTDGNELVAFMRYCNAMNWPNVITFHPPYTCERASWV